MRKIPTRIEELQNEIKRLKEKEELTEKEDTYLESLECMLQEELTTKW
jgi:hypothetical protein